MYQRDYLDTQLREQFKDFSPEPPDKVWQEIEKNLDDSSGRRLLPVWMRLAAAVTALIVASFSLWFLPSEDELMPLAGLDVPLHVDGLEIPASEAIAQNLPEVTMKSLQEPLSKPQAAVLNQPSSISDKFLKISPSKHNVVLPDKFAAGSGFRPTKDVSSSLQQFYKANIIAEAGNKKDKYPEVSVGAHIITQYSYRQRFASTNSTNGDIPFENLESPLYTMSYGLSLNIGLSELISVETGINYLNMGQYLNEIMAFSSADKAPLFDQTGSDYFYHPQTIITSQGSIKINDPSLYFADSQSFRVLTNKEFVNNQDAKSLSLYENGLSQHMSMIEFPVVMKVRIMESFVDLYVKGGMTGTYMLSNGVFLGKDIMQTPIGETYGLRDLNFSAVGGAALSLPITANLKLNLEPTGQIFLMPVVKGGMQSERTLPFNFSLFTSFTYDF